MQLAQRLGADPDDLAERRPRVRLGRALDLDPGEPVVGLPADATGVAHEVGVRLPTAAGGESDGQRDDEGERDEARGEARGEKGTGGMAHVRTRAGSP